VEGKKRGRKENQHRLRKRKKKDSLKKAETRSEEERVEVTT
jgi:hypothetical protein